MGTYTIQTAAQKQHKRSQEPPRAEVKNVYSYFHTRCRKESEGGRCRGLLFPAWQGGAIELSYPILHAERLQGMAIGPLVPRKHYLPTKLYQGTFIGAGDFHWLAWEAAQPLERIVAARIDPKPDLHKSPAAGPPTTPDWDNIFFFQA